MKNLAVVHRTSDYRNGPAAEGSTAKAVRSPEVVAITTLGLLPSIHAQFPFLPRGHPRGCPLALPAACSAAAARQPGPGRAAYKIFTAALDAIVEGVRREVPSDRLVYGAIDGMLKHARSAFELLRSAQLSPAARAAGGQLLRARHQIQSIDGDITVMSIFEGSPAYKKGLRRGDIIAQDRRRGRQGLDHRSGGHEAQGPEGHDGRHLASGAAATTA